MSTKKRDWAKEQADRLEARLSLGKADRRWREINGLSQQNVHDWSKASGIPLHNSPVAYWERRSLDPKGEFWFAREAYNTAIADKLFPSGLSRTVRDRMKAAEPFLTHEGKVATALDFQAMFGNRQPINSIYTKEEKITAIPKKPTDAECAKIGKLAAQHFKQIQREEVLSPKEAWKLFVDSEFSQMVKTEHLDSINDTLRGDQTLTFDIMKGVYLTYGRCPVVTAFRNISDLPIEGEFARLVHETELYVANLAKKQNKAFEMSVVEV